ncbi:phospholipid carrier-dependent glycosyltransferase [Candidatus Parcubacteria bacterium]|nr:phospholipid carrier-dependent glycosyltransferase [Candidatus Parcubacteria bacterium]
MSFKLSYKKLEEFAVVLSVILSGFITTAIFKMNNFFTFPSLDELLWYRRADIFWDKMFNFDFSGLVLSLQPGITVHWFAGFMVKFIDFDFSDVARRIAEKEALGLNFNDVMNVNDQVVYNLYRPISFAFNAPLFLLLTIFSVLFYYLLKKLGFNKIIASFSTLFFTTNIYLSYWTTPSDKMLIIFMTLSFLTFLVYISSENKKKYLFASAIFGAWAVLSKLTALFILPFYFLVAIFYLWPFDKEKIKIIIKDCFYWTLIFIFVCIIFLPTIIINPSEVYGLFFRTNVIESNYSAPEYSNGLIDYVKSLFFTASANPGMPLFFIVYFIINSKKKYRSVFASLPQKHIKTIVAYIALFIVMVTLMSKNRDIRFMSPAFVMMSVISATGLYGTIKIIKNKFKLTNQIYFAAVIILIMSQFFSIISDGELMRIIIENNFSV